MGPPCDGEAVCTQGSSKHWHHRGRFHCLHPSWIIAVLNEGTTPEPQHVAPSFHFATTACVLQGRQLSSHASVPTLVRLLVFACISAPRTCEFRKQNSSRPLSVYIEGAKHPELMFCRNVQVFFVSKYFFTGLTCLPWIIFFFQPHGYLFPSRFSQVFYF